MATEQQQIPVLLVNDAGDIYEYGGVADGGHLLKNLTAGKEGVLTAQQVKQNLKLPLRLNQLLQQNPGIVDMVRVLGLQITE